MEGDFFISDNDIVPEEDQARLMYWGNMATVAAFDIGDTACKIVSMSVETGLQVTAKRVYKAVGRFCSKSARTVRYYAEASAFYPQKIRDEFDVLSFSHFVFARTLDNWREVLEYAAERPQCTVEELRRKFIGIDEPEYGETSPDIGVDIANLLETIEKGGETSPIIQGNGKKYVAHDAVCAVSDLFDGLDNVERIVDTFDVSDGDLDRLSEIFEDIRDSMGEVLEIVRKAGERQPSVV